MKFLKKFNELYAYGSKQQEEAVKIFRELGIDDFTIGNDRLGNDNVFLFKKNGMSFEIYEIDSNAFAYNVAYKNNNDWEEFKTMNLKKSLEEII